MTLTRDEKTSQLRLFLGQVTNPRWYGNDLAEALHSVSELGLWPDVVESVSEEQALTCYRLIEKLRSNKFPAELRM